MKCKIRPVQASDAADIVDIYNWYVANTTVSFDVEPWTVAQMEQKIHAIAEHYPFLVWEDGGRVKAYCYAHAWKDRAAYQYTWETTIYLLPEAQGRGVGSALMLEFLQECQKKGCRSLIACITADNDSSISFHRKFGFNKASYFREVGNKFGEKLDVVDYQLILPE